MKKSLALVLALMMILSMFTMGITVSAADMPAGAIAINSVDGLKAMEAGKYYYLTADITLGTPAVLEEIDGSTTHDDGNGKQVQNDALEPAEEADLITIPAGVTLDGNGFTIYNGNYITNPGWYASNNKYTHSLAWTHEMFALQAGETITLKNLKLGSKDLPIYLHASTGETITGYSVNDIPGMFSDVEGANVVWNNVTFTVERYGRGLASQNIGPVITFPKGAHTLTNCEMNVSVMSAGSQYGGWFYTAASTASFNFTNCTNKGFQIYMGYNVDADGVRGEDTYGGGEYWGSVGGGYIHTTYAPVTMTNCINNLEIGATYGGEGYLFAGFVGNAGADINVTACVNNGNFSLNKITIGGGIVGRWNGNAGTFRIINSINNGDIKRSSSAGKTDANHGFGGITGHSGAKEVYEIIGCTNYGDIQGVSNLGGVVGFLEGTASLYTVKDCVNYGDITSVGNIEAGGIVGQGRMNLDIINCKNFGAINAANNNGGILGAGWTADTTKNITNCINYGAIGSTATKHAGGIVGITKTHKMTYNLTNCINYGKIVTKQYSGGMVAEINTSTIMNITGCQNYGEIAGVHAVAGFIGQTANGAEIIVTIKNSLNAGNVHQSSAAGEGIGGFFGRIGGTKPTLTLDGCINTGTITGSTKASDMYGSFGDTFGQFIGLYTAGGANNYTGNDVADAGIVAGFHNWSAEGAKKATITNCRALGAAVVADGATSLKGWISAVRNEDGTVTALEQKNYINNKIPVTEAPNNGYYGVNVEVNASGNNAIMGPDHLMNNPAFVMNALNSMTGQKFIAGNTELGEQSYVAATPMLRGYQMSLDGSSIRFIASINTSNYENVGFVYSIKANGNAVATDVTASANTIWTALNVAGADETLSTVSAADLGAKYMTGLTFNNVPAVGVYEFTVTPVATDVNGTTVYTGTSYVITVSHGAVTSVTK